MFKARSSMLRAFFVLQIVFGNSTRLVRDRTEMKQAKSGWPFWFVLLLPVGKTKIGWKSLRFVGGWVVGGFICLITNLS
jgi:hypothetical protein